MKMWEHASTVLSRWIRPKSNGMAVSHYAAISIRAADAARARQDWTKAALKYRRALATEPLLQHIWVQLGHMEKEAGANDLATAAYEEAFRLSPQDTEPLLHLGHMAKTWKQPVEAASYFLRALESDTRNLQAVAELARVMPDRDQGDERFWNAAMRILKIADTSGHSGAKEELPDHAILFDVTDLLSFFGQRRLPTGIQRVQIEISIAMLHHQAGIEPIFCIYSSARRGWVALPPADFLALCRLAKQSDDIKDPQWVDQLLQIYRRIAVARTVRLSATTTLVNLGTSWSDRNYLLDVRTNRARSGILYVPLVFDLIPLIEPAWFIRSLNRDYRAWFWSLLHSADGCLAISQATRQDLLDKAAERKVAFRADAVSVIPLDGDFRQSAADVAILKDYQLDNRTFVLLVSTLEPRKNHIGAFRAWMMLAADANISDLPRLVCVGGRGWLNEDIHRMLRDNPVLQDHVQILHGVPDDRLAALYHHCLFAIYPSFYEGWGLPVSEALSYGKVPAISAVASLPEAGGVFARYFDPRDPASIAATVRLLLNDESRNAGEAAIRQGYVPRTWQQIAQDLATKAKAILPRTQDNLPVVSAPGTWLLSFSSHEHDDALWGEPLRYGHAWQTPTQDGCSVTGNDAALRFHWTGIPGMELRLYIASGQGRVTVDTILGTSSATCQGGIDEQSILSWPLPDVPGAIQIGLHLLTREIVVEKLEILKRR